MKYDIWMEGYAATGEHGTATFLGAFEAKSFLEAVDKWKCSGASMTKYLTINNNIPYVWGCRLYDNETDARKSFG